MAASARANRRHPLNQGLIFWGMTGINNPPIEPSAIDTQAFDVDMVFGQTGLLNPTFTEGADMLRVQGPSGFRAFEFTDANEWAEWHSPAVTQTQENFSVFAWWKYFGGTTSGNHIFSCHDRGLGSDSWWELRLISDKLALTVDDNVTKTDAASGASGFDFDTDGSGDTWYFLGASRKSGGNIDFWLNGEKDGSSYDGSATGKMDLTGDKRFFGGNAPTLPSTVARMHTSDVRVYNRYVGADEARNLYHMALRGYPGMIDIRSPRIIMGASGSSPPPEEEDMFMEPVEMGGGLMMPASGGGVMMTW